MMHCSLPPTLKSLLAATVACLGLIMTSPAAMADTETEKQQRIEELTASIQKLKEELNAAKSSKDELQSSLQLSEEEVGKLTKKVEAIKEALAREKKQLAQLQANRAELEQQRLTQKDHIEETLVSVYQLGQQSQIKLLLNQEAPEKMGRLIRYHDYIVKAHQQQIERYLQTIDELNGLEPKLIAAQDSLKAQQQQLQQRQQQLQQSQRQRRTALKKLNASLKQKNQHLSLMTQDRQRLQNLLDEMISLANLPLPEDSTPFANTRGKLPMPTAGKIVYRYGSPQFDGKLKRNGVVIANKAGAKVVSVHHGRVIFSDYLRGHGLLLIIDHGDGYMSLYGHNQTLLKDIGDWASSGETIATVGNSGGQQRNALYFEIRHKGQPQNPQRWLAKG